MRIDCPHLLIPVRANIYGSNKIMWTFCRFASNLVNKLCYRALTATGSRIEKICFCSGFPSPEEALNNCGRNVEITSFSNSGHNLLIDLVLI